MKIQILLILFILFITFCFLYLTMECKNTTYLDEIAYQVLKELNIKINYTITVGNFKSPFTLFKANKQHSIHIPSSNMKDRESTIRVLMHELAHVIVGPQGHSPEFKKYETLLISKAETMHYITKGKKVSEFYPCKS